MQKNNNNLQISSPYDLNYNPLNKFLYSNNTKLRNFNYNLYQQLLKNEEEIKKYSQQINQIEFQNRQKINNKNLYNNNYSFFPEKIYKKKKINPSYLNSIPIEKSNKNIQCAICSDEIKINTNIIKLKCNHIFHEFCIKIWLKENYICPICRNENIL